jgi:hypothetical protein
MLVVLGLLPTIYSLLLIFLTQYCIAALTEHFTTCWTTLRADMVYFKFFCYAISCTVIQSYFYSDTNRHRRGLALNPTYACIQIHTRNVTSISGLH